MALSVFLAFLAGGVICTVAELLLDFTKMTPARILVLYVCLGVLLYAVGVFTPLRNIFGCGVSLPLLGFGANIAKGVSESVAKDGFFGIFSGPLSNCGGGICFTLLLGFVFALFFRGKAKRM